MSKHLNKIKKENPALAAQEDVQALAEDLDLYSTIKGFSNSPTGEILIGAVTEDINGAIEKLTQGYKTLPDVELRALCALIDARLSFVRSLTRADANYDYARVYLEALTS